MFGLSLNGTEGTDFTCSGSGQTFACGGAESFSPLQSVLVSLGRKLQAGDATLIAADGLIGRSTAYATTVVVAAINALAAKFPASWGQVAIPANLVPPAGAGYESAARFVATHAEELLALLGEIDSMFDVLSNIEQPVATKAIMRVKRTRPGLAFALGLAGVAVVIWFVSRSKHKLA